MRNTRRTLWKKKRNVNVAVVSVASIKHVSVVKTAAAVSKQD